MAVNLSPIWGAGAQLLDNSGNVLSGGKIYTYAAGTTTPAATYTSSTGLTANSNPIILNSAGRVPYEIWLTDGVSYKFVLKDSNDVLIATYDNLTGINSNFIAYTAQQEIQTATAGQTVFTLTTMQYQPATNNLSVFVDGVNQYGPGAQYAYVETDATTVTFVSGLHVGASVKFTTASPVSSSSTNAADVAYEPPFTGSVGTNVADKLAQTVSVKDFGAVGDGVTDDTDAIQAALSYINSINGGVLNFDNGAEYLINSLITVSQNNIVFQGNGAKLKTLSAYGIIDVTGENNTIQNFVFDQQNTSAIVASLSITGASNKVVSCVFNDICEYSLVVNAAATDTQIISNMFDKTDPTSFNVVIQGSKTLVDGNTMLSGDAGIVVNGNPEKVTITNNNIENQTEIGIDVIGNVSKQVTIANNIVSSCALGGIRIGTASAGGFYGTAVIISCNQVIDCGASGAASIAFTGDGVNGYSGIISDNIVSSANGGSQGIIVTNAENVLISGNSVTNAVSGIYLNAGAKQCKIVNNTIHDNASYGIAVNLSVLDTITNSVIDGNTIYSNGLTSLNGRGIVVNVGANLTITNNVIYDPLVTKKQNYGIELGANSSYAYLNGNRIYDNALGPIEIDSPRTYADYTWGDNFDNTANRTRYIANVGFPGTSTVTFNPGLWFAPRFVGGMSNANEFVWASSIAANSITLNRTASAGTLIVSVEARV